MNYKIKWPNHKRKKVREPKYKIRKFSLLSLPLERRAICVVHQIFLFETFLLLFFNRQSSITQNMLNFTLQKTHFFAASLFVPLNLSFTCHFLTSSWYKILVCPPTSNIIISNNLTLKKNTFFFWPPFSCNLQQILTSSLKLFGKKNSHPC